MTSARLAPGSELARVYAALASAGAAKEGDIGRRAIVPDPRRVKALLGYLRAANLAARVGENVWRLERDETKNKHDVGSAISDIVLDHVRDHRGCTVEDMQIAIGFSHRELRRALKTLRSRGDIEAERDGTFSRYRSTKARVLPLVGMVAGFGERHDCARDAECLREFTKREPDAHACHCRPGCTPIPVASGDALARATVRRRNNYTMAGY